MLRDHVSSRAGAEGAANYVNTANSNGETALHIVCSRKSTGKASQVDRDIVQALLQAGGDVGLDTYHVNLYLWARRPGLNPRYLLQTQETPLHYSAASGNVIVLGVLLASIRPTDLQRTVNKQNSLGRAPLLLAAKNGHVAGVVQLLQNQVFTLITSFNFKL
jgi:ankyrin repeat protein